MLQRVTDKGEPFWEIGGLFWPVKPAALGGRAGMGLIFAIKHEGIKIAAQQLQQRQAVRGRPEHPRWYPERGSTGGAAGRCLKQRDRPALSCAFSSPGAGLMLP